MKAVWITVACSVAVLLPFLMLANGIRAVKATTCSAYMLCISCSHSAI